MYNEKRPRLALSGWFHGAAESEMADWPEHTPSTSDGDINGNVVGGTSTLEQLKGKGPGGGDVGGAERDDGAPGEFVDDFLGGEVRQEREWGCCDWLATVWTTIKLLVILFHGAVQFRLPMSSWVKFWR